jgi:hypothetical protein
MTQFLYLVKCQQYHKIGIANDMRNRLAQLSTGNPFDLEVMALYGFDNAAPVEAAIHQRFSKIRRRGEWFEMGEKDISDFHNICSMLGGLIDLVPEPVSNDEIEVAEEMSQPADGGKWDYDAMIADGWRIEAFEGKRNTVGNGLVKTGHTYWQWRKSENGIRKSIYGGTIDSLPYTPEAMRRMYESAV